MRAMRPNGREQSYDLIAYLVHGLLLVYFVMHMPNAYDGGCVMRRKYQPAVLASKVKRACRGMRASKWVEVKQHEFSICDM